MGACQTKEAIEQNLRDAGCEERCVREFMQDLEQDRIQAGLKLLIWSAPFIILTACC